MSTGEINRFLGLIAQAHGATYTPKRSPASHVRPTIRAHLTAVTSSWYLDELRRRKRHGQALVVWFPRRSR